MKKITLMVAFLFVPIIAAAGVGVAEAMPLGGMALMPVMALARMPSRPP